MKHTLLAIFCFFISAGFTSADSLSLQSDSHIEFMYAPFSGNEGLSEITIEIQGQADNAQPTQLEVILMPEDKSSWFLEHADSTLPFSVQSLSAPSQLIGNKLISAINLAPNTEQYTAKFKIKIAASLFALPGQYSTQLRLQLKAASETTVIDEKLITLSALVNPRVQSNVAGTNTGFNHGYSFLTVDFGELESNESKQVFVQLRGNTQASIELSSENKGQLKHIDRNDSYINYHIDIDGVFSELSTPLIIERQADKTIHGSSYPLHITIGDVKGAYAGEYRDIIHIDVNAN